MKDFFKRAAAKVYEAVATHLYGTPYERALQQLDREHARLVGEGEDPDSSPFYKRLENRARLIGLETGPSARR